jgi:hypothetical protein
MSDKRRRGPASIPADVSTISLRDFLRGGYQHISEPTLVTYHAAVLGTFVPGVISSAYDWRPNAMLGEEAGAPENDAPPPMLASRASVRAISGPPASTDDEPATRRAYRRLREAANEPPLYLASAALPPIHAEPPALPTTTSDPAWLTGSIKRSSRRTTKGG